MRRSGCAWTLGLLTAAAVSAGAQAASLAGRWSATVTYRGVPIPFRFDIRQAGGALRANFLDGDRPTNPSSPARLDGDRLRFVFPSYASTLDLTSTGGRLDGSYTRGGVAAPVQAVRDEGGVTKGVGKAPAIGGEWITTTAGSKGEKAWRFIVHQSGPEVQATILRVDGDTGTLEGRWTGQAFRLSHFAGERPALLQVRPDGAGRLKLTLDDNDQHAELSAVRPGAAAALGLATTDPTRFTGVKDAHAPFRFAFPGLDGRRVASSDRRFRDKVVLVDVMGSWCPNCHDEAPFLESLYEKYRRKGLEIVALDFEQQPDQVAHPDRLKAFVARYHLTYPVLLGGERKDVQQALPQTTNLAAWPTTFFLGRDGRVKEVHVGFTSPGSGARDVETRNAMEKEVTTLLAQPAPRS